MPLFDHAGADASIVLRLAVAVVFAGVIGWQREAAQRAAGLRTHMLIGMSAALFVSLGEPLMDHFTVLRPPAPEARYQFDPLRLIEAVVAGVSFLGAGTIFVARGHEVQGLTTAAGILATAAMGIAVGLERYVLAAGVTLLCLVVLVIMRWVEKAAAPGGKAESK